MMRKTLKAICLVCLLFLTVICNGQQYQYLVLKGGGIRGIAYTGAIKVLEDKGVLQHITKVAGTSVGAITGTFICMGYSAAQIEDIMFKQNIAAFNDGEGYFIGGQLRLRKKYGWYKGKRMQQWLGNIIAQQTGNPDLTFMQLHELCKQDKKYKDLYVTATNVTQQKLIVFSWETYPDVAIKDAVRASASIPFYFTAMFLDNTGKLTNKPPKGTNCDILIDGGLLANYPIEIFNTPLDSANHSINAHTLGLKLDRPDQITYAAAHDGLAPFYIHSLPTYIAALYNLTLNQLNRGVSSEAEKKNTIYISTSNLSPRVRHITKEQKQLLFNNGLDGAHSFFQKNN
ncbi:MAG: patatin-like phospholipase family protein [Bacteroidetes bacterium]|nr:patatin-like phospholipase family protein [Bacteroidota bacterium]